MPTKGRRGSGAFHAYSEPEAHEIDAPTANSRPVSGIRPLAEVTSAAHTVGVVGRSRSSGCAGILDQGNDRASTFYMCQVTCMVLKSDIICRYTTLQRCRFNQRMASLNDLPSARRRSMYAFVSSSERYRTSAM